MYNASRTVNIRNMPLEQKRHLAELLLSVSGDDAVRALDQVPYPLPLNRKP